MAALGPRGARDDPERQRELFGRRALGVAVLSRVLPLLALLATLAPAAGAAEAAPIVLRVALRSPTRLDMDVVRPLVAIRVGQPLDRDEVRQTLRNFRLSGTATDIEAVEIPLAGGVEVELVVRPDVQVDKISITGKTAIAAGELAALVPQKAGQPLREDRVVRGVYKIEEKLGQEGWLDAVARVDVEPGKGSRRVRVDYDVEPGERTTVGQVLFDGIGPVDRAAALAALKAQPGDPYRAAVVRDDADRLLHYLVRSDYRLAQVSPAAVDRHPEAHAVDLKWNVELGPRFVFELVGADRAALEKRELLPFLGESGFDEALLQESIADIRRDFQRRGFYRVEVGEQRSEKDGVLHLRLEIVPGERYTLDEVRFEGNATFSSDRLEKLLATSPRRVLQIQGGRLVDEQLDEDLSNLRSFYALQGFDRVRIGPVEVEEPRPRRLRVTIPIVEGERLTVARISIEGLHALDPEAVAKSLPLAVDGPYHRLLLDSSVEDVRSRLEKLGYRTPVVEPEVGWNQATHAATVTLRVLEGARSTIEAVLVRGNTRTETSVIRRFADLHPGDPISNERLLSAQRALYRLGIFSSVAVRVPTSDSEFTAREVVIEVEEGQTRSIAYGAGYDSENGARGLFRFSIVDLGGRAATLQFDSIVAQRNQSYRTLYTQPYFFRWPVELRGALYKEVESHPSFDVRRRGLQLGVQRSFDHLNLGVYYDYRLVNEESQVPATQVPRESTNARVASIVPTLLVDHRDDPIDPHRGWSLSFSAERAVPIFLADADFLKLFGQATALAPLGYGTFATSLRFGAIYPHGASPDPTLRPIDAVPISELFFAGGRTTNRAFARDELGIPGQTLYIEPSGKPVPLGGAALALLNLEWRFPIAGPLGGDLFVDGGNVWREIQDFQPSQARWGAGVGVRYASPIGPLRLEIGWKIHRQSYEDPFVAFVSLGNAF